jgi:hypothetical protein
MSTASESISIANKTRHRAASTVLMTSPIVSVPEDGGHAAPPSISVFCTDIRFTVTRNE